MTGAPPFHTTGDANAHFFALAVARGRYVSHSGSLNTPASLVLYFSHSADVAPFSCVALSAEGETLASLWGDEFGTVEYILLRALEAEVPLAAWTLYPRANVTDHAFPDGPTREAYWENRRRLCVMLYRARVEASVAAALGKVEPLFHYDGAARLMDDGDPDNAEIWETVVNLAPDSSGDGSQE